MKKSIILIAALSFTVFSCTNKITPLVPNPSESITDIIPSASVSATPSNNPDKSNTDIALATASPDPVKTIYSYEGSTEFKGLFPISPSYGVIMSTNNSGKSVFSYVREVSGETKYVTEGPYAGESSTPIYSYTYVKTSDNKEIQIKDKNTVPVSIVIDNQSNFVILYLFEGKPFIRKYDINGNPLSEEIPLDKVSSDIYTFPYKKINMTADGGFFVSGVISNINSGNTSDKPVLEVFAQKFNSSLKPFSPVSKTKIDIVGSASDIGETHMRYKVDKENNYYISYENNGNIGIVKFDSNGNFLFDKTDLVTEHINYKNYDFIFDSNNQLIIIWLTKFDIKNLYVRKYSKYLGTFEDKKVELDNVNTNLTALSLTIDSKNYFTVGWVSKEKLTTNSNVLIRRYNNEFQPLGDMVLINKVPTGEYYSISYNTFIDLKTEINDNLNIFFSSEGNTYLKRFDKYSNLINP